MKKLHALYLVAALTLAPLGLQASEQQDEVNQAASIMARFRALPERGIPHHVLRDARGLAIITIAKGGFIFSGKMGEGVVVARTANGWSGPSFVRIGGGGFGPQIGGQVTELVLVLNTPAAVKAFSHGGNVQLGGELSLAAGPVGRTADAGIMPTAAVYAYSRSQGLFAGASLEGTLIVTDAAANERYYGRPVTARSILRNRIAAPRGAYVLKRMLV